MTCGVIQIDFCDVGLPMNGGVTIGNNFEGTADIDTDGSVVSITLSAISGGRETWKTFAVPFHRNVLSGDEAVIESLAGEIEEGYRALIREKLDEWSASLDEKEWEAPEAVE